MTTVGFSDTATAIPTPAEDVEFMRDAFDALAKSVSKACRFGDGSGDFVVGDRDKRLSVRIRTREPCRGVFYAF